MLTGQNGILNKASEAKEKTTEGNRQETIKLAYTNAKMSQYEGDTTDFGVNLRNELSSNGYNDAQVTGGSDGYVITIGENVYGIDSSENIVLSDWKDNGDYSFTSKTTGTTVKIGEYVNYSATPEDSTKTTYTSKKENSGCDDDQTFDVSSYSGSWQILGIGSNGGLMLISSDIIAPNSKSYYYLRGQAGFVNGITELDNISSIYGKGTYAKTARSVNVEDINKITGYVDNCYGVGTEHPCQTGNEVIYTNTGGTIYYKGTKFPTFTNYGSLDYNEEKGGAKSTVGLFNYWNGSGWKTLAKGESVKFKNNAYGYYPQTLSTTEGTGNIIKNKSDSESEYNLLFKDTKLKYYWLSSQSIHTRNGIVYFGIRYIKEGYVWGGVLYHSMNEVKTVCQGIRPVVSLKSDIKITGGDGTSTSAYILGE